MSQNKQDKRFRFLFVNSVGVCGVAIATFFAEFWPCIFKQM